MTDIRYTESTGGRQFLVRLPHQGDILQEIERFCQDQSIATAAFTLIGALSEVTLGAYDQQQQVYATFTRMAPLEIVSCSGNVSLKDDAPFVHAHILLADDAGQCVGGHLFSPSRLFAAEMNIRELTGEALHRTYDSTTGLMLWE